MATLLGGRRRIGEAGYAAGETMRFAAELFADVNDVLRLGSNTIQVSCGRCNSSFI